MRYGINSRELLLIDISVLCQIKSKSIIITCQFGLSQNVFLILNCAIGAISYANSYDVVPIGFHKEEQGF